MTDRREPGPLPPKIFFKIIVFKQIKGPPPILSKFCTQGPPLGSKLHWAPPDQNPGSAPGLTESFATYHLFVLFTEVSLDLQDKAHGRDEGVPALRGD